MFKLLNSVTVFLASLALLLSVWTGIVILSNSYTNHEIKGIIRGMYSNQRDFVINTTKLTRLLINDAESRISQRSEETKFDDGLLSIKESIKEEDKIDSIKISSDLMGQELGESEDNGNNPLGIYIEPSKIDSEVEVINLEDLENNQLRLENSN